MRLSVVVDLLRVVPVATCHVARLTIASVRPLWHKLRYWIKEAENAAIATTAPNTLGNGGMWRMTLRWPSMPLLLYPSRFPRRANKSVAGHFGTSATKIVQVSHVALTGQGQYNQ
jgi:hypothetical protein